MLKKIFCLLIASMFFVQTAFCGDINDWIRGDDSDAVEGDETIATLDDQITNYLQNPLSKALANHITGCTITVTDDETLTISAGSVVTTSATSVLRMRQNTSTTTAKNDGTGNGKLDEGTVGNDTWYAVYADSDADATTFTAILSENFSAPQANCTYYRLIGCALTDGTADWLKAYYFGNGNTVTVMWDVPMNETTTVSNGAAGGGWTALDCTSSMPSISTMGIFGLKSADSATTAGIWIRPTGSTWSTNIQNGVYAYPVDADPAGQRICATDGSQSIDYYNLAGDDSTAVDVEGFQFIR